MPLGIKCVSIDFNCIRIVIGRRNLPYCHCLVIVTERIDCTCIEICQYLLSIFVNVLRLSIYWDRVNMTSGRMYMLLSFSGIEIAAGRIGVYF